MNPIETIRNKPICRLSIAEIDMLPEDERRMAMGLLIDMARCGDLAMFMINPPGTRYETVVDRECGWVLKPFCTCGQPPAFVEAYFEYRPETASETP
jgi:hypothetical protein